MRNDSGLRSDRVTPDLRCVWKTAAGAGKYNGKAPKGWVICDLVCDRLQDLTSPYPTRPEAWAAYHQIKRVA